MPQKPEGAERPKGASDLWGTVPFALKRHESPHGQVTAVSMMKDEGPFVIEWVAHHLALGFTDLVVYTNDCSDGTDDMLIRLEELGLAHHRRNVIPEGLRPQPSALNHAQDEPVVGESDWVMVFDADEFLSIRHGDGTLDGLIGAAVGQGANGIVVTWRVFGSGGVVGWSRAPVTEQYLMAAPTSWNKGWGVKTLFRFDPDKWKLGIHRPKMKTKWIKTEFPDQVHWLNGSGRPMEDYFKFRGWRSITRTVGYDWVQLNHYAVKSVDSYAIRKMRGNVNLKKDKYNSDYWSLMDRNEVRDETMLRYTEKRDAVIAALLQDPVLNRLHFAAVERAEARLEELRATEAYRTLVADLARASAVPLAEIVAKPPQARDKAKIAALMSDVEKKRGAKAKDERKANPSPRVAPIPGSAYVAGATGLTEGEVAWHKNHSVMLPADPLVFAPPALAAIAAGKFERGLARRMPGVLPKGATVLEIGAGCGFLALHLAAVRPDLTLVIAEHDPVLRGLHDRIRAANAAIAPPRNAEIGPENATALRTLVSAVRPQVLILSDDTASVDDLADLLADGIGEGPLQVFLNGRFLQRWSDGLEAAEATLGAHGYSGPAFGFDPALTRGYARSAAVQSAK